MRLDEMIEMAKGLIPQSGLMLAKAIYTGRGSIRTEDLVWAMNEEGLSNQSAKPLIVVPPSARKARQPFTLAIILHPGVGYWDVDLGRSLGPRYAARDVVLCLQHVAYDTEPLPGLRANLIPESTVAAVIRGRCLS